MKMSDYSRDIDGAWEAGFRDGKAEAADEIERLRAALRRIDSRNDNPAVYNPEIQAVLDEALSRTAPPDAS